MLSPLLYKSEDESEDDESPQRPPHDMSFVRDYLMRTTRSSLKRDGGRGGNALLIVNGAESPPIAFSAGLPDGIRLSEPPIPGPKDVREATAAPTLMDGRKRWTEGW